MLYDIKDVCKQFDMTSRTLRYYEEEGLISSIRINDNVARQFTKEQVERIKEIKILRSLSFSIKDIREIYESDKDIMSVIKEKSNVLTEEIIRQEKKLRYIETALTKIQEGKNIFEESFFDTTTLQNKQQKVAIKMLDMFVNEDMTHLRECFVQHYRKYVDCNLFLSLWKDKNLEYGKFIKVHNIQAIKDVVYMTLEMEKMNLSLMIYFLDEYVCGMNFGNIGYNFGEVEDEE